MALSVQTPDGIVEGANGYVDVARLRAFALGRGVDLTAKTDDELEVAIVQATDFMDAAYSFVGYQARIEQGTAWPRRSVPLIRYLGLPLPILDACCRLAMRAAQGTALTSDPTLDPSGLTVSAKTDKVGPIESTVSYFGPLGDASGSLSKRFPDVEAALSRAGVLLSRSGGTLARA